MPGLVNPGDSGKSDRDMLVQYALERVEGLFRDGFENAFRKAKNMVEVLNARVAEAKKIDDIKFRDIFASPNQNYYTGPFEVAVIDTYTGIRICILGVEVSPNDVYDNGRIKKHLIPYGKEGKSLADFQKLLDGNKLPIGNGWGQLKARWGRQPGSSYEIGGVGVKTIPGVLDITAEVEAFLEKRISN